MEWEARGGCCGRGECKSKGLVNGEGEKEDAQGRV